MIPDQWYVILESREVPRRKPVGVTRLGEKMVLWRDTGGAVHCMADLCPHRGVALSIGRLCGDSIQCPFHGFEYDSTGRCVSIPANGRAAEPPKAFQVKTYPVREFDGYIYAWYGAQREEYPPLPHFAELIEAGFNYSSYSDHWTVDYSRAIENQLDVFHLPFVHATTIGRGNRTVADGPIVEEKHGGMEIWVYNRHDDGQTTARRPSELDAPRRPPFLLFKFPHLWMNRISDDFRITVYFTPVDDENCILYLRYYQRMVKLPLLRNLVAWLSNVFSIVILNQDKRVVLTQRPKKTDLRMGEKLIPADQPIITYRRRRREMIDAARK